MQQYINHNGVFVLSDQPLFTIKNRAFCYGDALFETIRYAYGKPQFLKEHLQRLRVSMDVFKMQYEITWDEFFFENLIIELGKKNHVTQDAKIRLTVYRNEGGLYAPENNTTSFVVESMPLEEVGYVLNFKGLTVDIFTEIKKLPSPLSAIKSANSAIYVLAGIFKVKQQLDECILVNDKGNITEAISSNIFAVKNGVLYTSPISEGCVNGVMRNKIIEIAQNNRMAVYELAMTQSVLLGADELFLTNAVTGIRWIVAYKQKRYFNDTSKKLIEKLNEIAANIDVSC